MDVPILGDSVELEFAESVESAPEPSVFVPESVPEPPVFVPESVPEPPVFVPESAPEPPVFVPESVPEPASSPKTALESVDTEPISLESDTTSIPESSASMIPSSAADTALIMPMTSTRNARRHKVFLISIKTT